MKNYLEYTCNDWARVIEFWGLTRLSDEEKEKLKNLINDIYIDGWTDGNAHSSALTPLEVSERVENDFNDSWSNMILKELKIGVDNDK